MSGRITLFRWIDSRIQVEGNFGLLLYESEETVPSVLMATNLVMALCFLLPFPAESTPHGSCFLNLHNRLSARK